MKKSLENRIFTISATSHEYEKRNRRLSRKNKRKERNDLKKIAKQYNIDHYDLSRIHNVYISTYKRENGVYVNIPIDKQRAKCFRNSKIYKDIKHDTNRKVRNMKMDKIGNHPGDYKKLVCFYYYVD